MCENGGESLDPRVQIELERLNNATDEINRLELDLEDARAAFRQLLCESAAKVEALRLKLGMCVERARPYYEARFSASEALKATRVAAVRYEKANGAHSAAREMVFLAEQGLGGRTLDPAWQEMLNHATQRVNEAERERGVAGQEHRIACIRHEAANAKVESLQKELKRAITKSRPYYELKAQFNHLLDIEKTKVERLETSVTSSKLTYADALRNLEHISDEIHRSRSNTRKRLQILNGNVAPPKPSTNAGDRDWSANDDDEEEYKRLPTALERERWGVGGAASEHDSDISDDVVVVGGGAVAGSRSGEWTEIDLEAVESPEDGADSETGKKGAGEAGLRGRGHPRLLRQKTLPNPKIEHEYASIKSKMKLDATISNWISKSLAKGDLDGGVSDSRRQSLDNILGPTSERVKEIFSHGMMMLNISSSNERRGSEPKNGNGAGDEKANRSGPRKLPSPLEKTMTYLTAEEDSSDTESLASVDMLTEDQISSLMLDKDLNQACEQVLGTTISNVVPPVTSTSRQLSP